MRIETDSTTLPQARGMLDVFPRQYVTPQTKRHIPPEVLLSHARMLHASERVCRAKATLDELNTLDFQHTLLNKSTT